MIENTVLKSKLGALGIVAGSNLYCSEGLGVDPSLIVLSRCHFCSKYRGAAGILVIAHAYCGDGPGSRNPRGSFCLTLLLPTSSKCIPGVKLASSVTRTGTGHPTSQCRDSGWYLSGKVVTTSRIKNSTRYYFTNI